jgi:phenylalanyl-tRNA synthetase beta chain
MKLGEQWLREWVNPPLTIKQIAERLTLAGLEVESISSVVPLFHKVQIGYIVSAAPHPDASRLKVCHVESGNPAEPLLTIVCGAANARAGIKVAVAHLGATLPNITIQERKIRGVISQGMLCSSSELGLSQESVGILELPDDAPMGEDLQKYLQFNDKLLSMHITPNRGDCLSVKGLARELAVLTALPFHSPAACAVSVSIPDQFPIRVLATNDCPCYLGRIIRGINPRVKTPLWLSERLHRSGFRSIHPVVDVTNYVLLELGQPLHAFDLARLDSEIIVRRARNGEKLSLLDEKEVVLDENTLVIADKSRVQAIAGVMGGLYAAVHEETVDVFLESAHFKANAIAGRARHYGIISESAYRFERGVDPNLAMQAIERATQLIVAIVGGKSGPVIACRSPIEQGAVSILLRYVQVEKILGFSLTEIEIESILRRLGMTVSKRASAENSWEVVAAPWRFDIHIEADLIEELVRVHGYNQIPLSIPTTSVQFSPEPETELPLNRVRQLLVDRDYHEVITYSFISPHDQKSIYPDEAALSLVNPISNELSVMRNSLWPGLLNAVLYNQKRQQSRIRLFETGLCFRKHNESISQTPYLALIAAGDKLQEQWRLPQEPLDFFTVKSDVEALFRLSKQLAKIEFLPGQHPALHPGQSCKIITGGIIIGYFGALHPKLLTQLNLLGPIYLFECLLSDLTHKEIPSFKSLSKFPIVRRDISFWIEEKIPAQDILKQVRRNAGPWLDDTYLFDVYHDKDQQQGKRSLALAILWQHPSRTLIDAEVDDMLKKVIDQLKNNFDIELRE